MAAESDEATLYDDLSAFMQLYKRALSLALAVLRHPDPPSPLSALADTLAALEPLASRSLPLDPQYILRHAAPFSVSSAGYSK
jgi:hypothetical protein